MRLPPYIRRPGEDLEAKCRRLLGELGAETPISATEVIGKAEMPNVVRPAYWWERD